METEGAVETAELEAPAAEVTETAPETTPGAETAAAGAEKAGRTFTDADVQRIVQERLKAWSKYGKPEELDAKLSEAEKIRQWGEQMRTQFAGGRKDLPGGAAAAPLSEEDKKVQAYLEKIYPGISKWQDQLKSFESRTQELHSFRWQSISDNNRKSLSELATKAGYAPDQVLQSDPNVPCIEKYVADSIRGNQADYQAYMQTGDQRIVQKHFEAVDKWIKGFAPKPPAAPAPGADRAVAAKKIAGLPPRMPAAGVSAPTSGKKKMSDKERIDAAFKAHSQS